MKRLLSLLAFLSFFHWSFSQEYIPFPLENTSWYNGFYQCNDIFENCLFYGADEFYTMGDTVINGNEMTKIYTSDSPNTWLWAGGSGINQFSSYVGALRDESGKVYFIPWFQEEEETLFDFTLEVGDEVDAYSAGWHSTIMVESISYVEFEGIVRKVIEFEYGYLRWIEGVGSDRGIFYDVMQNISGYFTYQECVRIDGEIVFSHEDGEFNCSVLSTKQSGLDFKVFPNPASNNFNVEGIQGNAILEIRDLQGRLIQSENINSTAQIIYLNNELNSGMYLVRIYSGSNQFTQRLLIE